MATTIHGDYTGAFRVTSLNAVDIANMTAVASVSTDIIVTMPDGTTNPLNPATDWVTGIHAPATLEAGVTIVSAVVKAATTNTITLVTTNGSAGAINPASVAAGGWSFSIQRH